MRFYIPGSDRPIIGSLFVLSKLLVIQLDTGNYLVDIEQLHSNSYFQKVVDHLIIINACNMISLNLLNEW